jgi:hypothetical protein
MCRRVMKSGKTVESIDLIGHRKEEQLLGELRFGNVSQVLIG